MIITQITPQKRKKDRVNIFIDDKFAFSLNLELLVKYHLKVDASIDDNQVQLIIKENDLLYWWERIINFLSFRPRSKKEITNYFKKKEVGDETQKILMSKLIERKYINDSEFVAWFVRQRQEFKPKGQKLLKLELMQKGIEKSTIDEYFSSASPIDETEQAFVIVQKKIQHWKNLDDFSLKQKIQGYLGRRGYNWETISAVLKRLNP
jgi:regulatory protein